MQSALPEGQDLLRNAEELHLLRTEVQELIKFVALNYLAVVKAIKKRNRHLKVILRQRIRHLVGDAR
jgi:SPX domain protein involved in polyphosphate accumulation